MAISLRRPERARHRALLSAGFAAVASLAAGASCSDDKGATSNDGTGDGSTAASSAGGASAIGTPAGSTEGSSTEAGSSSEGASSTASGSSMGGSSSVDGASSTVSSNTTDGGGGTGGVPECDASAAPPIQRLGLETVVESDELSVMVYALQPPGSNDWYLVDALGYVRVFSNGVLQPTPFLDVSSEVQDSTFGSSAPSGGSQNYDDERGLLSIAFPPDYETSGKFYVTLIPTTIASDNTDHDLVLEYTRSAADPLVADASSRSVILDLEPGGEGYVEGDTFSYAKYHNASTALFGPDGMLYVGMGDGGGDCNAARPGVPQDVSSPYGKILRLDPREPAPHAAAGNPFADGGDARVFHYGVRNPFRFSFDPATGDIYIGEVGQWSHDSIAYAPASSPGSNFGWPTFEGTQQNPSDQCGARAAHAPNPSSIWLMAARAAFRT
jgi:hypothetical protein